MAYSKTLKGRYFDILGHFFSIYCIYKIFMVRHISYILYSHRYFNAFVLQCIVNIIFDRVGKVGMLCLATIIQYITVYV